MAKKSAKKVNDSLFPVDHNAKTGDLLNEYLAGYEISDTVNKPKELEEKTKDIRQDLSKAHIKPHKKGYLAKSEGDQQKANAEAITGLIKEGYGSLVGNDFKMSDDAKDLYVADAFGQYGISTYSELLKRVINEGSLDMDMDAPEARQTLLYRLLEHVTHSKHDDAKRLQTIGRTLRTDHKHRDGVVDTLGEIIGMDYNPSATAADALEDHGEHVRIKRMEYESLAGPKTYGKKHKKGNVIPFPDKKDDTKYMRDAA